MTDWRGRSFHLSLCLFLPEETKRSHDSFSFYIDEASPVGPEQPETVQNFVSVFGTVAKKLMRKWLATQTMNFTGQLGAGIRYFDLRISTKPRDPDNELYFAHGLFSAKVNEGLEEINAFLTDHHKEVVFLDFNHFYGMQKYHHEKLVQMLKDIYGNKMCPAIFAQEVSLKYLWEKDYQVLVFYHSPVALEVPFLWPGQMMPAPWANTTDPEKLIQFLQASITERRKKGSFFISQVVLTPKASTVVKGVASGLRETITERQNFVLYTLGKDEDRGWTRRLGKVRDHQTAGTNMEGSTGSLSASCAT
uniref:Phosphatidylinositol-specific phospholipase C X domain-containing protein n=1 Tax=Felis catus TaxID=9685 RepID=A0ABI7Z4C8_FELCA